VTLDNLSANKTPAIRAWCMRSKVELCLTPTNASWANPIEAQFGPPRSSTMANSYYPNHTVLARGLHAYLRWRNTNARHPEPWPPNAANAPASAANANNSGALNVRRLVGAGPGVGAGPTWRAGLRHRRRLRRRA